MGWKKILTAGLVNDSYTKEEVSAILWGDYTPEAAAQRKDIDPDDKVKYPKGSPQLAELVREYRKEVPQKGTDGYTDDERAAIEWYVNNTTSNPTMMDSDSTPETIRQEALAGYKPGSQALKALVDDYLKANPCKQDSIDAPTFSIGDLGQWGKMAYNRASLEIIPDSERRKTR